MKFDESKHPRDSDGKFTESEKRREAVKKYSDTPTEDMRNMGIPFDEVVTIKMDADIQKQFDRATPKERSKIAYRYIMDNLCGKYPAQDGREIIISGVGADKMSHTTNETKIRVLPVLAELIRVGRLQGVKEVEHNKFVKFAYYKVFFQMGHDTFSALLNVGIRPNGVSTLYDINPFNKQ